MFTLAARRLGYPVAVWDPDPEAPAHRVATHSFPVSFTDQHILARFADMVSVVTYEWENIPGELCRALEQRKPVRPSSAVLRVIQDRLEQKGFLAAHGFPVPPFATLTAPDQLAGIVRRVGYPALCKTATSGYDGKGQWRINREADVLEVERALSESAQPGMRWIVESFVPFERELSILVVRGSDGQSCTYPLTENEHEEGILRTTMVPASVSPAEAERAAALARQVVNRLEGVGVFCLELFQLSSGDFLINEIAPRPHNSGHYTLDACSVSQFEQQVRTTSGMPLGEVRLLSPAVMVNLIGGDAETLMKGAGCRALLDIPGAVLHLYGKREIRPRRKMGHITFLGETLSLARDRAKQFRDGLANRSTLSA
ncbi:MAG: 5-(carboxyamino)imidazole ribonucleotide synthase [Nitrospirae bacterium RBG_19FT_COMBO_58_9]|nr:MAG: 5-(carboxyamino)imidazole ribonucleotide synthase [Nitrospirae bacterium RBG_19FT_COMBO_58_9]